MKDLLKEAIADAKAVRETALANAKLALEEAFTPRLQSMLSAKLAEEMSDDEDMNEGDDEDMDVAADVPAEAPAAEEAPAEEAPEEAPAEEDDDLDLDEIIKELEMDEMDSSDIGTGDNKVADLEADTKVDDELYEEDDMEVSAEDGMDEDIDINEIIAALREEDETEKEEMKEEDDKEEMKEELEEAYDVIRFLKGKINEVNLLNAKLLYSNKLFRNFSLNEAQKMKVIESFDRSINLREVKLVYSTLAESFKMPAAGKKVVKESYASKPVASTKPATQVITEGTELANRFKKLAGLKK